MTKRKRILTTGTTITYDPEDEYGESRIVQEVLERENESFEEMEEFIQEEMYRRIYSEYDCTGSWFTSRHQLFKYKNYWIVRLYEQLDC